MKNQNHLNEQEYDEEDSIEDLTSKAVGAGGRLKDGSSWCCAREQISLNYSEEGTFEELGQ